MRYAIVAAMFAAVFTFNFYHDGRFTHVINSGVISTIPEKPQPQYIEYIVYRVF